MKSAFYCSVTTVLFVISALTSCKKDDEAVPDYHIDAPVVSLHYNETHTFSITEGPTAVAANTFTWSSANQTVGNVTSGGIFKAKKVGTTFIKAVSGDKVVTAEVTVTPYSAMCAEPYFEYGATKAEVKSKESRALLLENALGLRYAGENGRIRDVVYLYEDGALTTSTLLLANNNSVVQEAATFFAERYQFAGAEDDVYFFTDGSSVVIRVGVDTDLGFYALYYHVPPGLGTTAFKMQSIQSVTRQHIQQTKDFILSKRVD